MLFYGPIYIILIIVCVTSAESNQNYQALSLRFDQVIFATQTGQKLLYRPPITGLEQNIFSPIKWAAASVADFNTSRCIQELVELFNGTQKEEKWAMKIIDAWGKPLPSGLLTGNLYWVGNYDECLDNLYQPESKSFLQQPFESQYCAFSPQPPNRGAKTSGLVIGVCVPKSCSGEQLAMIANKLQTKTNYTDNNFGCSTERQPFSAGPIITTVVLTLLVSLILMGTIVDLMLAYNTDFVSLVKAYICCNKLSSSTTSLLDDSHISLSTEVLINESTTVMFQPLPIPFIAEFSLVRILQKIFTIPNIDNQTDFTFLNGIRVLSLFLVILGHSLLYGLQFSSNTLDVLSWTQKFAFLIIINTSLSVDTVFVLSGFLTAIIFIRQVKNNEFNGKSALSISLFFKYYIHRYLRLTPTLMLVMLVSVNFTAYFGRGPLFPSKNGFEREGCSKYWWTNLLYLNNLIKPNDSCLDVAWYLANDMQFHWVAPLALVQFALKQKRISFLVVSLFILISIVCTTTILIANPKMDANINSLSGDTSYFDKIYDTPWCRITAYAFGLLIGFIVLDVGRSYRLNMFAKAGGNILALIVAFICLIVPYFGMIASHSLSRPLMITCEALFRTLWSMVIGWLIFLCSTDNMKIIKKILSCSIFVPLAHLNYSAYLIHLMIIYTMVYNLIEPIHFQTHVLVQYFISNTVLSYMAAIIVVLLFEAPFFVLEKNYLNID